LDALNQCILDWFISCAGRNSRDSVYYFLTLQYAAEDGVCTIQVLSGNSGDKELTSVRVGPGVGHGKNARLVEFKCGMEFILERVTRTAAAVSIRVSTLDHKVRNDPVEDQSVVEVTIRQSDKIIYCLRCFF